MRTALGKIKKILRWERVAGRLMVGGWGMEWMERAEGWLKDEEGRGMDKRRGGPRDG